MFDVDRKQVRKSATDGNEYTISKLICPGCRLWADVVSIEEVV